MGMRVHLVDPSGQALGLALGLAEAGHRVDYARPEHWQHGKPGELASAIEQVAAHRCGPPATFEPLPAADLLVVVDCFADRLADLVAGRLNDPNPPRSPWAFTFDSRTYPSRLAACLELAVQAPRVVVVDSSDRATPREVAFEGLPHAVLLAREVPVGIASRWRPLPFLYNQALLVLERSAELAAWWSHPEHRRKSHDWAFYGTVDHRRYGGRRATALAAVREAWPDLSGDIACGMTFHQTMQRMQSSRCVLDLPGAGRLCFRLHEALAFGIPVFAPRVPGTEDPPEIVLPAGVAAVRVADPYAATAMPWEQVQGVYRAAYATEVAAACLLRAAAHSRRTFASALPFASSSTSLSR